MVTHDPRIAAYADRIIFLKDGVMVNETRLEVGAQPTQQPVTA
jgi:putative ABC transport system ATP-binding protein